MRLSVACVQFAPAKAKVDENLARIGETILEVSREGVDLVVFPEASTTGYFLEGGVLESSLTSQGLLERLTNFRPERPIDAVIGFYEKEGTLLYNSAAYVSWDGAAWQLVTSYHKFFLPTYGVFDEDRFVGRGTAPGTVETRFGRFGIMICEDAWHSILSTLLALDGATVMIVPSASPARGFSEDRPSNLLRYERVLTGIAEEHGVYCLNAMLTGFEGGKGFVGGGMVVDPFGKLIAQSPVAEEHVLVTEIDLDQVTLARAGSPLISDLESAWSDVQAWVAAR
ncbi:MAG: (R)-stereoselective amidase [Fimbriimonadaceae bacterium]|nr:(R)-stereoselective amidase [Fimbriimonadaceae bacterium]